MTNIGYVSDCQEIIICVTNFSEINLFITIFNKNKQHDF